MAKDKNNKKTLRSASIITGSLIIIVAIVVQVVLDVQYWKHTEYPSTSSVTNMISQAVQNTSEPAIIEPISRKVYLPDASLVLPPKPKDMSNILYNYTTGTNNSISEVNVSLKNAISAATAKMLSADAQGTVRHDSAYVFSKVPNLQACARGVKLVFGESADYSNKVVLVKKLNDGRTVRIYNDEINCPTDLTPLANYLKQIESY